MQQRHLPADMNLWASQWKAGSRCLTISSSTDVLPLRWLSRKKGELLMSLLRATPLWNSYWNLTMGPHTCHDLHVWCHRVVLQSQAR